jgi:hypothetical protein
MAENIVKLNPTLPALKRFLLDVKAMPDARPVLKDLKRLAREHPYGSGERKALEWLIDIVETFRIQRFLADEAGPRGRIRKLSPEMEKTMKLAEQIARTHGSQAGQR